MRRAVYMAGLVIVAAALASCGGPVYTYRYKLTLEVETPEGVKSASSVVEIREYMVKFPAKAIRGAVTGQALYLDVGKNQQPLVALLTRRIGTSIEPYFPDYSKYFGIHYEWAENNPGLEALVTKRGAKDLAVIDLPELVSFASPSYPNTVIAVDPRNLEATFGSGVKWHRMTIEITDDPITKGLEAKLPWVTKMDTTMLDGDPLHRYGTSATLANSLSPADFLRKGY
jgi:hypothetical protein